MKLIRNILTALLLLVSLCATGRASEMIKRHSSESGLSNNVKKTDIVVVTNYSKDYLWSRRIVEYITDRVNKQGRSMEIVHCPIGYATDSHAADSLLTFLKSSLDFLNPASLALIGSPTFCLVEYIDSWFEDIPMFLIGGQDSAYSIDNLTKLEDGSVNDGLEELSVSELKKKFNVVSRICPIYMNELMGLIKALIPQVNKIFFITAGDQFSNFKEVDLRECINALYPDVVMETLNSHSNTIGELIARLNSADPKTSAAIFSSWPDSDIDQQSSLRVSSTLSSLSLLRFPLFTIRDNGWMDASSEILGGVFDDEDVLYLDIDDALDRIFKGEQPRNIPDYADALALTRLNLDKLTKLGIDPSLCPMDVEFTGSQELFYYKYKVIKYTLLTIIIAILFFFLAYILKSSWELQLFKRSINDLPMGYSLARLTKGENGDFVDLKTIFANKHLKDEVPELGDVLSESPKLRYPELLNEFLTNVNNAVHRGQKSFSFDLYSKRFDRYLTFTTVMLPVKMIGIVMEDVTEMINANKRLEEAKLKAEKADMAKTAFIHNISHEVRTPLNAICGFSQLLTLPGDFCNEQEKAEYQDYILNNTEMLTMVISDLLNISAIEEGRYIIKLSDCYCNSIAQHALKSVEHRVPKGVVLLFESGVGEDFHFVSDSQRIQQILINYLTNACKHTRKGFVKLSISLDEIPGKVVFAVTDTGHGIDPANAERIFERFVKLETDENYDGKGLGLFICRQIAELLGGETKLDTNYKEGARFLLILDNK